jgi:hypothetical protein
MAEQGWRLFGNQCNLINKVLAKDSDSALRHSKLYHKVTVALRRQFGIKGVQGNFDRQLIVDDIALCTVRINEIEMFLISFFSAKKDTHEKLENILLKLKAHRYEMIDSLRFMSGGKKVSQQMRVEKGFQKGLDRSKNMRRVEEINKILGLSHDDAEAGDSPGIEPEVQVEETEGQQPPEQA